MECAVVCPTGVVSVYDLTHKPEISFYLVCYLTQSFHIFKIHYVCGVETYSVNIKLLYPETDYIADVISDFRISLIKLYKEVISAPIFIRKAVVVRVVAPEIYIAIPIFVGGIFSFFLN